jgi:hypothetical protein
LSSCYNKTMEPGSLSFFPRVGAQESISLQSILDDLLNQSSVSLLAYIQSHSLQSPEGTHLCRLVLRERDQLNWIFSIPEIEAAFFSQSLSPGDEALDLLRKHFLQTEKYKHHHHSSKAFYVSEDLVLWNRYFSDLEMLGISLKSHLCVNLRNYLEWCRLQKGLKNNEMLSKMFFPLYKELKTQVGVALPFLVETLKMILFLHPSHSGALLERTRILKLCGSDQDGCEFLQLAYSEGVREPEVLTHLAQYLGDTKQIQELKELVDNLFPKSVARRTKDFYLRISDVLYEAELPLESLFYCLKAISFQPHDKQPYANLRRILLELNNYGFAEQCYQEYLSMAGDPVPQVAIQVPKQLTSESLYYKLSALQDWTIVDSPCLFLSTHKRLRIEFQHSDLGRSQIFYPDDHGPYLLVADQGIWEMSRLKNEKIENESAYTYQGFSFVPRSEALAKLTPFHFQ